MIKFVIIRSNEAHYNQYIGQSLKKLPSVQSCDVHPDKTSGVSHLWNVGINAFINDKDSKLTDDDIICFVHEDVSIVDPNFNQKLEMAFKLKPEIGLFSVAGTSKLNPSGLWFEDISAIRGHWVQTQEQNTIIMGKDNVGFYDDVVATHKFFMAIRPSILKEGLRFDETFINDLYNIDFCLQVLERGYKIGIIDILLHHVSSREGNYGIDLLVTKWSEKGINFPISIDQFPKLNEIEGVEISL